MGQRPMLILVLSIVVVGGTVVVGAHALGAVYNPNNREIVFQDALAIVADIQLWKLKPVEYEGGFGIEGFEGITFQSLGYRHTMFSKRVYRTENGCYQLDTRGEHHDAVLTISSPSCGKKDYVAHVMVRGLGPDNLDWQHIPPTP